MTFSNLSTFIIDCTFHILTNYTYINFMYTTLYMYLLYSQQGWQCPLWQGSWQVCWPHWSFLPHTNSHKWSESCIVKAHWKYTLYLHNHIKAHIFLMTYANSHECAYIEMHYESSLELLAYMSWGNIHVPGLWWELNSHLYNSGVLLYQLRYQALGSKYVHTYACILMPTCLEKQALLPRMTESTVHVYGHTCTL